jgi:8-oxo-dGTP pyrophosphatase MutT (NUDIX family)
MFSGRVKTRAVTKTPNQSRQVAALPLRSTAAGAAEVLLITSRETQRWVIPKGWPMPGLSDPDAAATEAREEAGVTGKIHSKPLGAYLYWKRRAAHFDLVEVTVYRLDVRAQLDTWRERGERQARWMPLPEAAEAVQEPGLQGILIALDTQLSRVA